MPTITSTSGRPESSSDADASPRTTLSCVICREHDMSLWTKLGLGYRQNAGGCSKVICCAEEAAAATYLVRYRLSSNVKEGGGVKDGCVNELLYVVDQHCTRRIKRNN